MFSHFAFCFYVFIIDLDKNNINVSLGIHYKCKAYKESKILKVFPSQRVQNNLFKNVAMLHAARMLTFISLVDI